MLAPRRLHLLLLDHRSIWPGCRLWLVCALISATLCGCGSNSVASSGSGPIATPLAVGQGPQLGYAWVASDQSLRPILGVAGSSLFGQSVVPAGTYALGAASVRSGLALLQEADGSVYLMSLPSGSPQRVGSTTFPAAAQIAFAPSGQSALLFKPGTSTLILLTGLNSTPAAQTLSAPAGLLSAAVGDTAQVAVVAGNGPYLVAMLTGTKSPLASIAGVGGLSFLTGNDSLLVADSAASTAALILNASTAPTLQGLASAALQAPLAIAGSRDGHFALVANTPTTPTPGTTSPGTTSTLVRFDLTGGTAPLSIACACQPAELDALNGNATFRLTAAGSATTWLVDATAATPRTLFIPPAVQR